MRPLTLILGAAAAIGIAAAVSAEPATDRIQLAQAQDSGAQSGAGTGASQRGNTGNREGGASTTRGSEGSGAAAGLLQPRPGDRAERNARNEPHDGSRALQGARVRFAAAVGRRRRAHGRKR